MEMQKIEQTLFPLSATDRLAFPIVGIGASAGGFRALATLLQNMPASPGMALIVVIHLPANERSMAASILQSSTHLPVVEVTHALPILPDQIFVIPPGHSLKMVDGCLTLDEPGRTRGDPDTIDAFLRSLAEAHEENAIGVVLSGLGSDGTAGLTCIKENGGVTIVQLPADAEASSMPRSAIDAGMADFVLTAAQIPAKLCDLRGITQTIRSHAARRPELTADIPANLSIDIGPNPHLALNEALTLLHERTGHDFRDYKPPLLIRRLERRLQVRGLADLPSYCRLLRKDDSESLELLKDLMIGVTQFFRDRDAFAALERDVISHIFEKRGHDEEIRVWVAACSTGEEAYSLAMLLADQCAAKQHAPGFQVFASDIDAHAIHTARSGLYPQSIAAEVPAERLQRYFTLENGKYRVRKSLRDRVLFAEHNLLEQPAFSRVDLVSCRNFLIYLNREMQRRVLEKFHFALNHGGHLMLGSAESAVDSPDLFARVDALHCIYQAKMVAHAIRPEPALIRYERLAAPTPREAVSAPPSRGRMFSFGDIHLHKVAQMAAPSILINGTGDIVHVAEQASGFLRHIGGEPTREIVALVAPDLRLDLRTAIFQAQQSGRQVSTGPVRCAHGEKTRCIDVTVTPFQDPHAEGLLMLVSFAECDDSEPATNAIELHNESLFHRLDEELQHTRQKLTDTIDDAERSRAKLCTAVEELQTTVTEQRARRMELEAKNAELQSINEELKTVAQQLQLNLEDATKTSDDLNNLAVSSDAATLFLDRDMRIVRYTPRIADLFNVIPADVGRPLQHLTNKLDQPMLAEETAKVFKTLQPFEREVVSEAGLSYIVRVHPYRTSQDHIEGAVMTFFDITSRRAAEEALRRSEERLRAAFSIRSVGVLFWGPDFRLADVNEAFLRMSGFTRDEAVGKRWQEFTPQEFHSVSAAAIADVAVRGETDTFEKQYLRKDGSRWWGLFAPRRIGEEVVEFVLDVTRQHDAQEALRRSEERFRRAISVQKVGVLFFDLSGHMREANAAFQQMCGYSEEELCSTAHWEKLTAPEYHEVTKGHARDLAERGETEPYEKQMVRKDGSRWWGMFAPTRLSGTGEDSECVEFVMDITDQKRG